MELSAPSIGWRMSQAEMIRESEPELNSTGQPK